MLIAKFFHKKYFIFLILLFALIIRLITFIGVIGADPQDEGIYMNIVGDILENNFNYNHYKNLPPHYLANPAETFALRMMINYPVAFFLKILGVSQFTFALYELLSSLGLIYVTYLIGRLFFNINIALVAAFLLSFFPLEVMYATRLGGGDIALSFFIATSFYLFSHGSLKRNMLNIFLAGLFLGVGYQVKEFAIVLIPILLIANSLLNKGFFKPMTIFMAAFIFLMSISGLFYYVKTGNPFVQTKILVSAGQYKYKHEYVIEKNIDGLIKIRNTDGSPFYYTKLLFGNFRHKPGINYFGLAPFLLLFSLGYILIKSRILSRKYFITPSLTLPLFTLRKGGGEGGGIFMLEDALQRHECLISKRFFCIFAWWLLFFVFLEFSFVNMDFSHKPPYLVYEMIFKNPRYLMPLLPPWVIIISFFLTECFFNKESNLLKLLGILVLFLYLSSSIFFIVKARSIFLDGIKDTREAYNYFRKIKTDKPIYLDHLLWGQFKFLSSFKNNSQFRLLPKDEDLINLRDSYIIQGGARSIDIVKEYVGSIGPQYIFPHWILEKELKGALTTHRGSNLRIFYIPLYPPPPPPPQPKAPSLLDLLLKNRPKEGERPFERLLEQLKEKKSK